MEEAVKKYGGLSQELIALNQVTLEIKEGEMVVILGTSGYGKSTLFNILGGMDCLEQLSIAEYANNLPQKMSGG